MTFNLEKIKKYFYKLFKKTIFVAQLFLATDMPLYSANAAFFLVMTCIPLFMIIFSTISIVPTIEIDDLVANINLLFPNLPYVSEVMESIIKIAQDLATKNALSINIIIALFTGSTALYSFTIGIRKIHGITHTSNFIKLRLMSIFNMFLFFIALIAIFVTFILGSMILGYVAEYLPFAEKAIGKILGFRYLIAILILFILLQSIYATSTNFARKIRHNFLGTIISTLLWLIISNIFSFYFKTFPLSASVYGSLTGVVIVLMWEYICMNLIFLGAVINEVFYPQMRILEEQKQSILKQIAIGSDEDVDKILEERYKLRKVPKFDRPNLTKDNYYIDSD